MRIIAAFLCLTLISAGASAGSIGLGPNDRLLVIASTKDMDTAVGIAELYAEAKSSVVQSDNGWMAVVVGPFKEKSVKAMLEAHPEIGDVPKDAFISDGQNFIDYAWLPDYEKLAALTEYVVGSPAKLSSGDLSFEVSMAGDEDNPGPATAVGSRAGEQLFSFTTDAEYALLGAEAGVVKLDPGSTSPQLVFTRYTGGAHCCTKTWIATEIPGQTGWSLVDAGVLDGGGFGLRDLDDDKALELVSVDNSFLYAFDSYAGSFPPVIVQQLRNGKLIDVSNRPEFRPQLMRNLARLDFIAKLDPELWKQNGFLIGWLAAKMRFGQGEEAWQVVQENHDAKSDFGPQICKSGKPVEDCASEDLQAIPVLKAMAEFLKDKDYGPLPQGAITAMRK